MPSEVVEAVAGPPMPFDFEATFQEDFARITRVIARVIRDPSRAEDLAVEAFWRLGTSSGDRMGGADPTAEGQTLLHAYAAATSVGAR